MNEPNKKKMDAYMVEPSAQPAAGKTDRFTARVDNGVHVITFTQTNVLDAFEIEKLGDAIYDHIRTLDAPRVVVNLENVKHLSSAALGMLVALRKVVVEKKGGGIGMANINTDLLSIFKMTRLDRLIKIHDSTDKAVSSLV